MGVVIWVEIVILLLKGMKFFYYLGKIVVRWIEKIEMEEFIRSLVGF